MEMILHLSLIFHFEISHDVKSLIKVNSRELLTAPHNASRDRKTSFQCSPSARYLLFFSPFVGHTKDYSFRNPQIYT